MVSFLFSCVLWCDNVIPKIYPPCLPIPFSSSCILHIYIYIYIFFFFHKDTKKQNLPIHFLFLLYIALNYLFLQIIDLTNITWIMPIASFYLPCDQNLDNIKFYHFKFSSNFPNLIHMISAITGLVQLSSELFTQVHPPSVQCKCNYISLNANSNGPNLYAI